MEKSIKTLFKFSLAFIFFQGVFADYAHAQRTINLSTDEAVLERLGRLKNETFSKDKICIQRQNEFAEIIIIGFIRSDYGCLLEGVFVNGSYYLDGEDLSKNAFHRLGWKSMNRIRREKLAKFWVEKVLLAFYDVLYTKDKDFPRENRATYRGGIPPKIREFHPPRVTTKKDGETVVTLWTSVMRRKKEFQQHEFRFAKDGNLM